MNNNHHVPDYESPPRKRRLTDLNDNANTRTWLEAFGMSANHDEVTARTADTDGFPVCARHASRKTILALKINAVFERWDLKATVMAGHPGDPNIIRKASGHIARTALGHTRSRRPGIFYLFERTDISPPVLKFGVDFCEYDDDVEGRIVGHETSSCRPEIDHHAVSGHFADAGLFDHVVNMLLDPVQEQIACPSACSTSTLLLEPVNEKIACPCGKNYEEYLALGKSQSRRSKVDLLDIDLAMNSAAGNVVASAFADSMFSVIEMRNCLRDETSGHKMGAIRGLPLSFLPPARGKGIASPPRNPPRNPVATGRSSPQTRDSCGL
ncbi:hypothetical protein HDU88_000924 [Geranomyces variabilis]|nr:hypothetical protein HDU88_000924 [Geranomyces variabilis]